MCKHVTVGLKRSAAIRSGGECPCGALRFMACGAVQHSGDNYPSGALSAICMGGYSQGAAADCTVLARASHRRRDNWVMGCGVACTSGQQHTCRLCAPHARGRCALAAREGTPLRGAEHVGTSNSGVRRLKQSVRYQVPARTAPSGALGARPAAVVRTGSAGGALGAPSATRRLVPSGTAGGAGSP